jgi:hypothetical protein
VRLAGYRTLAIVFWQAWVVEEVWGSAASFQPLIGDEKVAAAQSGCC